MDSLSRLPLFPLNVVLFPKMLLPLHIFEERYKLMVGRCLNEALPFGVTLANDDNVFNIGCTAENVQVVKRYPDGRMDILTEGRRRFQLKEHFQDKAYLEGRVEYFEDDEEIFNRDLLEIAVELFKNVLGRGDNPEVELDLSLSPTDISFFMASSIGLDLEKKQEMLELKSTNSRLKMILEFLEEGEKKRLVKGNGDLKRIK